MVSYASPKLERLHRLLYESNSWLSDGDTLEFRSDGYAGRERASQIQMHRILRMHFARIRLCTRWISASGICVARTNAGIRFVDAPDLVRRALDDIFLVHLDNDFDFVLGAIAALCHGCTNTLLNAHSPPLLSESQLRLECVEDFAVVRTASRHRRFCRICASSAVCPLRATSQFGSTVRNELERKPTHARGVLPRRAPGYKISWIYFRNDFVLWCTRVRRELAHTASPLHFVVSFWSIIARLLSRRGATESQFVNARVVSAWWSCTVQHSKTVALEFCISEQ